MPDTESSSASASTRHLPGTFAGVGLLVIVGLEALTLASLPPTVATVARIALVIGALAFLSWWLRPRLDLLAASQSELARQNEEFLALHRASLVISSHLALDEVLERVVDEARALVGARYGALSVIDDSGRIQAFRTSGLDSATREAMGSPPAGRGLLGVVLTEGQRLRIEDIRSDPRSVGFPSAHPEMTTLLAVPVICEGPYRGNLYLSEREDGRVFSARDEESLVRFGRQAAIAIDNAYLHRQVRELAAARERIRIAHDMHDGLAQILAYVNTKAQVVREYCRQEKYGDATSHLEELAEAARGVYADVRAQILELRASAPGERGLESALREYVESWSSQSGLAAELDLPEAIELDPNVELQTLRILQESLTNVRKHAGASRVRVQASQNAERFVLVVEDDGRGFEGGGLHRGPRPRFGLSTMRERALAVGGRLEIDSVPGEGTRIQAILPVRLSG